MADAGNYTSSNEAGAAGRGGDPPALAMRLQQLLKMRREELGQHEGPIFTIAEVELRMSFLKREIQLQRRIFTSEETGLQQQEDDRISWEEFLSFILLGHLSGNIVVQDTAMPHSDTGLLERPQAAYLHSLTPQQRHAAVERGDGVSGALAACMVLDVFCALDPGLSGVISRTDVQRSMGTTASGAGEAAAAPTHSASVIAFLTPERLGALPWDERGETGFVGLVHAMDEWSGAAGTEYESDTEIPGDGGEERIVQPIVCVDERRQGGGCVLM